MVKKAEQLNKTVKITRNDIINPEGVSLFAEDVSKSLFLNASAFKIRNSLYWTAEETLFSLITLLLEEQDFKYKISLAMFLADALGIRLSPVLIVSQEAVRLARTPYEKELIKKAVKLIYDRPDKIANALAYADYLGDNAKDLYPAYYKKALRNAFERFDEYTLRKFKLKRRKVKTADVIKLLHPRPRTERLSRLYKAIIENGKEAAIEKDTVITEVLSDTTKTKTEKLKWVGDNLAKLPINSIIRNLTQVSPTTHNLNTLETRLKTALRAVGGIPVVKVVNPFDVLTAGMKCGDSEILNVVDRALSDFVRNNNLGVTGLNISFVVDVSGSMAGDSINIVAQYISLLLPMLKNNNIKLHSFNSTVSNRTDLVPLYKANADSPVTLYSLFIRDFRTGGSTALADAVRITKRTDSPDLMIVFSDEVTWRDIHGSSKIFDVGVPLIAINPEPQGKFTAYNPNSPNVIKLSSLDAKILYYIPVLANFDKFKAWLKEYYL